MITDAYITLQSSQMERNRHVIHHVDPRDNSLSSLHKSGREIPADANCQVTIVVRVVLWN